MFRELLNRLVLSRFLSNMTVLDIPTFVLIEVFFLALSSIFFGERINIFFAIALYILTGLVCYIVFVRENRAKADQRIKTIASDYYNGLNRIRLEKPLFYKPTVDGIRTLIRWEEFMPTSVAAEVKEAIKNCVSVESETVESFDFGLIDSLSASKSFGQNFSNDISGSWFETAAEWGKAMYPEFNDNHYFSALCEKDFEQNIYHIEKKEGFPADEPIDVHYYGWYQRYMGFQTGGSHHSALVIHQIRHQGRKYRRNANLKRFEVTPEPLEKLDDYYLFVTNIDMRAVIDDEHTTCEPLSVFKYLVGQDVNPYSILGSVENKAVFISLSKAKIPHLDEFNRWYTEQVEIGTIIELKALMKNTAKFCTTPYCHQINNVCISDPTRKSDKIAHAQYWSTKVD